MGSLLVLHFHGLVTRNWLNSIRTWYCMGISCRIVRSKKKNVMQWMGVKNKEWLKRNLNGLLLKIILINGTACIFDKKLRSWESLEKNYSLLKFVTSNFIQVFVSRVDILTSWMKWPWDTYWGKNDNDFNLVETSEMLKTAGQIASRYYSQQCIRPKMKYLLICGTLDNSINALLSVTHG